LSLKNYPTNFASVFPALPHTTIYYAATDDESIITRSEP